MPDALTTLMNLDSPSNYGGRVDVYKPNTLRDNARAGYLARFLGLPDDGSIPESDMEGAYQAVQAEKDADAQRKADAALASERMKGEYGLQGERIKGDYSVKAAQAAAERAALEHSTQRDFNASQGDLNRAAATERSHYAQDASTGRTSMMQQGSSNRQQAGLRETRAKGLESGKIDPTYPPVNGVGDAAKYLAGFVGIGPYGRGNAAAAEAAKLRTENSQDYSSAAGDTDAVANYYKQKYPGLSGDALMSQLVHDQSDASPEEIQDLARRIEGGR